jgi:hypothetical protein
MREELNLQCYVRNRVSGTLLGGGVGALCRVDPPDDVR